MKQNFLRLFCFFVLACRLLPCLCAQQLPRPVGFVNDFAQVMNGKDAQEIEELSAAVKEKTGAELAVVTVNTFAPYAAIEEFSIALAQEWGVGERGRDNGVLLVLAVSERKVRIEVGYGLEGAIPDSVAGRILDTAVIPAFRENDFSRGLAQGIRAIAAYVAKENGVSLDGFDLPETASAAVRGYAFTYIFLLFFSFFVLMFIITAVFALRRSGRRGFSYSPVSPVNSGSFGTGSSFSSSGRSFSGFSGGSFGGGGASRGF